MKTIFITIYKHNLNYILLSTQIFTFITQQTQTFTHLSLLKYIQHIFIFQTTQQQIYQYSQFI